MKFFLNIVFILALTGVSRAQIAVGTTSPDPSARFQVDASAGTNDNPKGFLPPRVILTSTSSIAPFSTITPATGLLVYNTATAGTAPNNVTPGFYYYDGSKWQRILSEQPDATVEFDKATPTDAGIVFTPNSPASKDFVYVSTVNGSQWTWNGTSYVTYTPPASTPWFLSGGTSDAGSNKSGRIYRTGNVGIGTSNPQAALDVSSTTQGILVPRMTTAQRNAMVSPATSTLVFDTSLGEYYFFTGTQWTPLVTKASDKIFQVFSKATNQTVSIIPGDVTWSNAAGQGSALFFSSANITLPPNKTFLITGYLAIASGTASIWATYQIVNGSNTTADFVLSTRGFIEASTEGVNDSNGGPAIAMINTGGSSRQIKLRILSRQGSGPVVTTSNSDAYAETILLVQEL